MVDITKYPEGAKAVADLIDFLPDDKAKMDYLMFVVTRVLWY